MKKYSISFLFAVLSCVMAPLANAAELKIGVVDVRAVLQKSPQMLVINAQLEKEFKPRQQKILEINKDLKAKVDQLNKNGATMKDADRVALQDEIIKERTEAQNELSTFQQELSEAQNQSTQKLVAQLNQVISKMAQQGKYDIILQREAVPYFDTKYDRTAEVSQAMSQASGR